MIKSVIDAEIAKFSSLSNQWWQEKGAYTVLHAYNKVRVNYIHNIIQDNNLPNDIHILDVGCGGGILTESLNKLGYKVTGIDASLESIEEAKNHAHKTGLNINYYHDTPENLVSTNSKKYQIVLAMEIIEHVNNPSYFVETILQLLDTNGLIFFSTINRNLQSLLMAKYMAEYVLKWVPKNTHDHSKFITPRELEQMLENNGVNMTQINGIKFNIFNRKWELSRNPKVNYICCAQKNT